MDALRKVHYMNAASRNEPIFSPILIKFYCNVDFIEDVMYAVFTNLGLKLLDTSLKGKC